MKDKNEKKRQKALAVVEFMLFAGIACAVPFLSVHMRSLGLSTVHEAMEVHAVSGIAVCLVVPLVVSYSLDPTFISLKQYICSLEICGGEDLRGRNRRQNFVTTSAGGHSLSKWCLCCSLIISAVCYAALLAVPRVVRIPRQPLFDFDCYFFASSTSPKGSTARTGALRLEKCSNWATCQDAATSFGADTLFRISNCRQKCNMNGSSTGTTTIPSHIVHICFGPMTFKELTNAEKRSWTRRLCLVHDPRTDVPENASHVEFQADLTKWRFSEFQNVSVSEFLKIDPRAPSYVIDVCAFGPTVIPAFPNALKVRGQPRGSLSCGSLPFSSSRDCTLRCLLSMESDESKHRLRYSKSTSCQEIVGNPDRTYWTYLSLRALADVSLICSICLLDSFRFYHQFRWEALYSVGSDRMRAWNTAALAVFPPILGALVDRFGNYSPALVVSAGFQLIAMAAAIALPLPGGGPSATYTIHAPLSDDDVLRLRRFWWSWSETCFIFTTALCLGALWSFPQVFSPWLYQDLVGFEHWTLGLGEALCFGCALPLQAFSSTLLREVGETYLGIAAFAFHGLRQAGLYFISSSTISKSAWWWPLPLEAMKAVALPLGWLALCARGELALANENPGQKSLVALHAVLAVAHFGAGRIIGVCLGGLLSSKFGFPVAFGAAFGLASISATASFIAHFGYFRIQHRHRQAKLRSRQITRALAMHGSKLELCEPEDGWQALNGTEQHLQDEIFTLVSEDERSLSSL